MAQRDPSEDRVADLLDAAHDALRAIELALPDLRPGIAAHGAPAPALAATLLRESARGLRRALDRFITDTQPLD